MTPYQQCGDNVNACTSPAISDGGAQMQGKGLGVRPRLGRTRLCRPGVRLEWASPQATALNSQTPA